MKKKKIKYFPIRLFSGTVDTALIELRADPRTGVRTFFNEVYFLFTHVLSFSVCAV